MLRSERVCLALASMMLVAACEIEEVAIPRTTGKLAMHGVLSATAQSQVVLLERTRSGSVVASPPFELPSPLGNDAGIAESGAVVTMTTPGGATLVAWEDILVNPDGNGRGVYRFALRGDSLERNGTYRLTIRTTKDEVLTAETAVPAGTAVTTAEARSFDRARDELVVEWPRVAGARSYFVRIETPFGPRSFFTDSTRLRLAGELRNVDVAGLPRVFIPGFPQAVTVSAVDSNFYDWFRSHNDAISGTGLVSHVRGGLGVFGSLVRLRWYDLSVVAPQTEPVAGTFVFAGAEVASTPYLALELYVESRAARSDQADALSGRYQKRPILGVRGCLTCGLLGSTRGNRVDLIFLGGWFANDTSEVFTGEIRGDTIVGRYLRQGGVGRFVRQP
ncbi:MAG TPA: hypothetical protein VHM67_11065 [Gemmatimonadaceae bacterium]|nr:hypothetical protein [Gemmatimonadaceae bacterium]